MEDQRIPLRRRSAGKVLLAFGIALLFFVGVFGYLVFDAWQRLRSGELDLSRYNDATALTTTGAAASGVTTVSRSVVETSDDPALGPADAAVTIVEFGDFECPFCRRAFTVLKQLREDYGDRIRIIFRDFPVDSVHRNANDAAVAAACAHAQGKFWEYHDLLYLHQEELSEALYNSIASQLRLDLEAFAVCQEDSGVLTEARSDYSAGVQFGVRGTPTWFVNGRKLEGALPVDLFRQVVELGLAGKLD